MQNNPIHYYCAFVVPGVRLKEFLGKDYGTRQPKMKCPSSETGPTELKYNFPRCKIIFLFFLFRLIFKARVELSRVSDLRK